jgi:autotransporter-associated beta strand protein
MQVIGKLQISLGAAVLLGVPLVSAPGAAAAPASDTWTGAASTDFNDPANWTNGDPAGTQVHFVSSSTTPSINVSAPITIAGIAMDASSPARTLTGSQITLGVAGQSDQAGFYAFINSATQPGNMIIQNDVALGADLTIELRSHANELEIDGAVSGAHNLRQQPNDASAVALNLKGDNSFTGGLSWASGTLKLGSAHALGGPTNVLTIAAGGNSPRIDNSSGASLTLTNNNAQLWDAPFTFMGSNDLNMGTGTITLGADWSQSLGLYHGVTMDHGSLTIAGDIVATNAWQNFSVTRSNNGNSSVVTLAGNNRYEGITDVEGGVTQLNLTGSLLMAINGTGSTGGAASTSSTIYTSGGGNGALRLDGILNLDIAGLTHDPGTFTWLLVSVNNFAAGPGPDGNGGMQWGGDFGLALDGGPAFTSAGGGEYTLSESGRDWTFYQSTGVLTLTQVPEPASVMLAGFGAAGLLLRRRRS